MRDERRDRGRIERRVAQLHRAHLAHARHGVRGARDDHAVPRPHRGDRLVVGARGAAVSILVEQRAGAGVRDALPVRLPRSRGAAARHDVARGIHHDLVGALAHAGVGRLLPRDRTARARVLDGAERGAPGGDLRDPGHDDVSRRVERDGLRLVRAAAVAPLLPQDRAARSVELRGVEVAIAAALHETRDDDVARAADRERDRLIGAAPVDRPLPHEGSAGARVLEHLDVVVSRRVGAHREKHDVAGRVERDLRGVVVAPAVEVACPRGRAARPGELDHAHVARAAGARDLGGEDGIVRAVDGNEIRGAGAEAALPERGSGGRGELGDVDVVGARARAHAGDDRVARAVHRDRVAHVVAARTTRDHALPALRAVGRRERRHEHVAVRPGRGRSREHDVARGIGGHASGDQHAVAQRGRGAGGPGDRARPDRLRAGMRRHQRERRDREYSKESLAHERLQSR